MNLLKVVANWGADRKILLRLYRALIWSKLDYGSIVYESARKSYLKKLAAQYILKLKSNTSYPTHEVIFNPSFKNLFEQKPNVIPTLSIRMSQFIEDLHINIDGFNIPYFQVVS